jgi:uncharacterized glyoxalase superfamily protein PhnB
MTTSTASILFGSTRPEELRAWYRDRLVPEHTGDGLLTFGGLGLAFEQRDDVAATNGEPGRMIVNFHVDDIEALAARLDTVGVTWIAPVEERPFAKIGTFLDPDGNYLQLIQFKPDHEVG